jgi:hypothetical protein
MVLARDSNGTTLYARGCDVEETETAISFDRAKGLWSILGDARMSEQRKAIRDAIELLDKDDGVGPRAIAEVANVSEDVAKQLCRKMVEAGTLSKLGRGQYRRTKMRPHSTRMPVILKPDDHDTWLSGSPEDAIGLARPYLAGEMRIIWPAKCVSRTEVIKQIRRLEAMPELSADSDRDEKDPGRLQLKLLCSRTLPCRGTQVRRFVG